MSDPSDRRPLKSRDTGWARACAARLARAGLSPDMISAGSMAFAVGGAVLFVAQGEARGAARAVELVLAAACVQLRLLCNLLDGMVAVEHGRGSPEGPIWNELPDRVADILFLAGAGYGAWLSGVGWGDDAGWAAAALAVLTAYVRELGQALGQPADFRGPMAKPHRMALLTAACVVAAAEPLWGWRGQSLAIALAAVAAGAAVTAARRTFTLAVRLRGTP